MLCIQKDEGITISNSLATGTYVQATELDLQFPKSAQLHPLIIIGIFYVENSSSLDQKDNIASISFDSIKEFVLKIIEKVEKGEILL